MESRMTCRQVVDALAEYVAVTLEPGKRERCDVHLASCVRCAAYLRGYRETVRLIKLLGSASSTDAAEAMPAALADAILAATTRRPR